MIRRFWRWLTEAIARLRRTGTFYIGSHESLPIPLKKEEEQEMIAAFKNGDMHARDILIEHNLRLVVYIARRFDNAKTPIEDLISIGSIGLIKAIETFNADKKIKLATYASRCIENEILMHLRKTSRMKGEVSLDEPLNSDGDGNELLLSDILGTDEHLITDDVEKKMERQHMFHAIQKLDERERYIMECRFGLAGKEEMTQKEVADHLGISQSYISRLEKKIIQELRNHLNQLTS
ncbi:MULTISPECIES: RNA polymerase sporulation sigma factor SigE [Rummeliibacillus]|jgi:RNA polymerase sporulation-specific sigma factor|uniref:RNA polymerase sporulation sigma factor SigE n=1 Tax=Rummeliibacillus TaxID=648802 RepID=UPI0011B3D2B9|nr:MULTISPECIES: RNA polymerase sporulation sigma factor SigE [Rummeliibacillus]MBO2534487.1 RNA polymerase sporulation sigma factor SigE [Rummeliibacillus suwonensis]